MKNLAKFFVAVAALFVGVSCTTDTTEDLGQQIVGKGQTVLTVSTGESVLDTKTSLGGKVDGTYPIYWSNGDKLSLNGVASAPLADVEANSTTATFTWEGTFDAPFCVAYPASAEGTVTFAAEQSYVEGTFSQNAVPMIGYSDEVGVSGVQLEYLAGVLQFNIAEIAKTGETAKLASVIIETVDGTPIAGVFDCDFATGTVKPQAGSRSSIDYSFGEEGMPVEVGASFHVAVPAGVYEAVKVIFIEQDGAAYEATLRAPDSKPIGVGQVREFSVKYDANTTYAVIKDAQTLDQFAEAVAETPALEAVVLKDVDASSLTDWAPIEGFTGLLRGNGKTISGLTQPLFGELKGTVTNLTYEANVAPGAAASATDASKNLAAIFANTTNGATLTSCTVKGSLTINNSVYVPTTTVKTGEFWFAGFAGKSTNSTFQNCTNEATITITQSMKATNKNTYVIVGGIVAHSVSGSAFVNCVNNGPINYNDAGAYVGKDSGGFGGTPQTNGYLGCIVGYIADADSYLDGCVNNGKYTQHGKSMRTFSAGGVIGAIATSTKGVSNCVNNGDIDAKAFNIYGNLGGVIGSISVTATNCINNGNISVVPVKKSNKQYAYIGGFAGHSSGTITSCENNGDLLVDATVVAKTYGSGYLRIGGIVGNDGGTTSNCTNNGNITSKGVRGGIYHYKTTTVEEEQEDGTTVEVTKQSGFDETSRSAVGGVVGYKYNGTLSGCTNTGKNTYDVTAYSKAADYIQPQNIGGIVGYSVAIVTDCHNEGDVIFPATANVNTIAMGGVVGFTTKNINNCTNKGRVEMLGTVNGDPAGYHTMLVGGIAGRGTYITNSRNLVEGEVTVSGQFVSSNTIDRETEDSDGNPIPIADQNLRPEFGGNWGSLGIGGVAGYIASGVSHSSSNAAALTVSSNIVAVPQTDGKNNYSQSPIVIAGVGGYMSNEDYYDLSNSGKITVSGTHSYTATGLYVGGVISRSANKGGHTYTNIDNSGNIEISTKFVNKIACKVGGIMGYNNLPKLLNCDNEGHITITSEANLTNTLYVGGIAASTDKHKDGINCSTFDTCNNSGHITVNANSVPGNLVVGGLVGYIVSAIKDTEMVKNCSNSGNISITGTDLTGGVFAGGLTGSQGSAVIKVTDFTNSGNISFSGSANKAYIGGIGGSITQSVANYSNIKSTGKVIATGSLTATGDYMVGGLAGRASTAMNGWEVNATVSAPEAATCGIVVGAPRSYGTANGCYVQGKISREGEAEVTLDASNFTDYIYSDAYNAADACVFGPKPVQE